MKRLLITAYYVALTVGGFYSLWILMLRNGTVDAINAAVASGVLPDGTLLTTPPSLSRFRQSLSPQVAFYDGVINGKHGVHHLLITTMLPSIQAILTCMMLSYVPEGTPKWRSDLALPVWSYLNMTWGSAVVFPVYFLLGLYGLTRADRNPRMQPNIRITAADGFSTLITAILGLGLPLMLLYPTTGRCSTETRHTLIAYHRIATLAFCFLRPSLALLLNIFVSESPHSSSSRSGRRMLNATYWILSAYCAALHSRAIILSVSRKSFGDVFLPWHTTADKTVRHRFLADSAHLFLQYDLLVVALAVVPYVYYLSSLQTNNSGTLAAVGRLCKALIGTVLLGPGAITALALALYGLPKEKRDIGATKDK